MSWLFLLGGMLIWIAHFSAVYAASSVGALYGDANSGAVKLAVAALTLAAAIGDGALLFAAAGRAPRLRREGDDLERFWNGAAALGAFISFVAVLWQGLPVLAIPG